MAKKNRSTTKQQNEQFQQLLKDMGITSKSTKVSNDDLQEINEMFGE